MNKNNNKSVGLKNMQQQGRLYVTLGTQCLCLMSVPIPCAMGHFWGRGEGSDEV